MNRLFFSILVAFTSTMAFAQSNIFDGITEDGLKLYQSRESEISMKLENVRPRLLDIPNDPNSETAKRRLDMLQIQMKHDLRLSDEESMQIAKIIIAKKYNMLDIAMAKIQIPDSPKTEETEIDISEHEDGEDGIITDTFIKNIQKYKEFGSFHDGLARVGRDGKYGYMNIKGEEVIRCIYEDVRSFSEGVAAVEKNSKWGFINANGEEVVPCIYDYSHSFSGSMAVVQKNGKWGCINSLGVEIIPCKYDYFRSFSEGMAVVEKNGKRGYVNTKGEETVSCKYDIYYTEKIDYNFTDGLAKVCKDKKYGFVNHKGEEVVPCIYDYCHSFSEGMALVEKDNWYGYVDADGNVAIPCKYGGAKDFSEGLAAVRNDKYIDGSFCANVSSIETDWGFIDVKGKVIIPLKYGLPYNECALFSEGIVVVENAYKRYGYIDREGKEIAPCKYTVARPFSNGVAYVERNGYKGYIDKNGVEALVNM